MEESFVPGGQGWIKMENEISWSPVLKVKKEAMALYCAVMFGACEGSLIKRKEDIESDSAKFAGDEGVYILFFNYLCAVTADTTSELHVFRHNRNALRVDSAQVSIFEQADEVCFGSLLKRHYGGALESKIAFEILSNLTNETLEWEFANKKIRAFLELADFSKSDGSGTIAMWLHDSNEWGCGTTSGNSRQLARCFATGGFTSSLFGTSHSEVVE